MQQSEKWVSVQTSAPKNKQFYFTMRRAAGGKVTVRKEFYDPALGWRSDDKAGTVCYWADIQENGE